MNTLFSRHSNSVQVGKTWREVSALLRIILSVFIFGSTSAVVQSAPSETGVFRLEVRDVKEYEKPFVPILGHEYRLLLRESGNEVLRWRMMRHGDTKDTYIVSSMTVQPSRYRVEMLVHDKPPGLIASIAIKEGEQSVTVIRVFRNGSIEPASLLELEMIEKQRLESKRSHEQKVRDAIFEPLPPEEWRNVEGEGREGSSTP